MLLRTRRSGEPLPSIHRRATAQRSGLMRRASVSHNANVLGDLTVAEQQQPQFRIHDNPSIVETYANTFLGSVFDGGAVSLTFGTIRVVLEKTGAGQPIRGQETVIQVTHRLTLSPTAALELMNGLNTMMTQLKAQAQRAMQRQGPIPAAP
jgi:hypothetical protein